MINSSPTGTVNSRTRVLVFPCGSECGLEIGRSLTGHKDIELYGASSTPDHGQFCFPNYIGNLPYINDFRFINALNEVVRENAIDLVYPAMDSVVTALAEKVDILEVPIVGPDKDVARIAVSKRKTYEALRAVIPCPREFRRSEIRTSDFPLFLKPDIGYGARGTALVENTNELDIRLRDSSELMILEYLPGEEYTVDCFTNRRGELLFASARERRRISKGISVNTIDVSPALNDSFIRLAGIINSKMRFNGAWFCQFKKAANGQLTLLEVAPRIAGSVGLQRSRGVNLPLLSVYNAIGVDVAVRANTYTVEYDRAFYGKMRISKVFTSLYIDFDDCLLINDKFINPELLRLIGHYRNQGKKVVLITRHRGDISRRLEKLGVNGLFDKVIHLQRGECKADYIRDLDALLVDDSFAERSAAMARGIAALDPNTVDCLF